MTRESFPASTRFHTGTGELKKQVRVVWDGYKGRFGGHQATRTQHAVNMNSLYFFLVRACAQQCFPKTITYRCPLMNLTMVMPVVPPEQWINILNYLEPMNWGRLMCFYAYVTQYNVSLSEQYRFHQICDRYPTHYPSLRWMFWEIIKRMHTTIVPQLV